MEAADGNWVLGCLKNLASPIMTRKSLQKFPNEQSFQNSIYGKCPRKSFHYMQNSPWDLNLSIFREQSSIIREMAQKSDCVIVGRCADDILQEMNPLRVFVYADMEAKLTRCRQRSASDEQMTDREILSNIRRIDKSRSEYYGLYTGKVWGDKRSYDLCINTAQISMERACALLAEFFR